MLGFEQLIYAHNRDAEIRVSSGNRQSSSKHPPSLEILDRTSWTPPPIRSDEDKRDEVIRPRVLVFESWWQW
jgi:hypothetical protein